MNELLYHGLSYVLCVHQHRYMLMCSYCSIHAARSGCRYDVYSVANPFIQYIINVRILELIGGAEDSGTGTVVPRWKHVSSFELTPSKTTGRSDDGRVCSKRVHTGHEQAL